jgi:hypothetical protein
VGARAGHRNASRTRPENSRTLADSISTLIVEETKRLKKLARRKKSAASQNPQPAPSRATPKA